MLSTEIVQPKAMSGVFGEDIYSATSTTDFEIPAATSTSASDTCVMDNGFLPITSEPLPPDGTGIAPARNNFNGLFYLSTDQRVFLQNGGVITYDSDVATAIGGYPAGAILDYVSNGNLSHVRSLKDNNQENFVTDPTKINGVDWAYAYDRPSVLSVLEQIYPIGAIFIGTTSACPMAALFGTWELVAQDRCLQGSSVNHEANTTIAAGLPNLTGTFPVDNSSFVDGSLFQIYTSSKTGATGDSGLQYGCYFNASSANSIYGNSTTVQPPAYVVNIWRRTA